jgi:hypothetical protein
MSLEIRLLKDNEYSDIVHFFNNARNIDHKEQNDFRTLERFRWEFVEGPAGPAIYIVAVDMDDVSKPKIIGTQCAIPFYMLSSCNERVLTAKSEDTLLDIASLKKYKGRDIVKEMYHVLFQECTKAGIRFIWGFTNVVATFKRLGFEIPFHTKNAVLTIRPIQAYSYLSRLNANNTRKDKFKILVLSYLSSLYGLKKAFLTALPSGYRLVDRETINTTLFFSFGTEKPTYYMLEQDDAYMKWRLWDNPSDIGYKTKQLINKQGQLMAEMVYSNCNGITYIEQMLFHAQLNDHVKLSFIKETICDMVKDKSAIIRFVGLETNKINMHEIGLLKKVGFIFAKKGAGFVLKQLNPDFLIDATNIILSRLYFQGTRQ